MEKEKNILKNYILYFLCFLSVIVVGVSRPQAVAITDYATKYYYYSANDNSSTTSTDYRSGSSNRVTLDGATAPTYANGEGFNGFYNRVNYSLTKGSIYTLSLNVNYNSVLPSEFSQNTINNRLLNTDFAHCSACTITAVSGNIREYNSTNQAVSGAKDYVVHMSYTFVATSSVSQFYIGSYTGDDRTLGLDNHQTTVIVIVASLDISNDNSSTIINQNDTIINQNNQIIEQNNQNTQDIIDANNQNSQDIINNQNQNNQNMINSQKVCNFINKNNISIDNRYLASNGSASPSNNFGITDFINIENSTINILSVAETASNACFYTSNINTSLISCSSTLDNGIGNLSIPNNALYVRFTINKNMNAPTFKICKDGNQAISDQNEESEKTRKGILAKIGDLFNTLFSNDDADISGLNNMVGWLPPGPVDSIINLPLSFFNALTNTLTGTCVAVSVNIPFVDKTLNLPCFDSYMSQYLSGFSTLWTLVGFIGSVFILYHYLLALYKWIDDTLTLRENNLPGYYDDNWGGGA